MTGVELDDERLLVTGIASRGYEWTVSSGALRRNISSGGPR
ncbi:hypothetical protein [Streptomyces sp. NPDC058268]